MQSVLAHPVVIHEDGEQIHIPAPLHGAHSAQVGGTTIVDRADTAVVVGPDREAGTAYVPALVTLPEPGTAPAVRRTTPSLALDDGLTVLLDRTFVIGTSPLAPSSHPYAEPLAVSDPAGSTSATHLLVSPARDGAWVIDLHSQTGVAISDEHGRMLHLPPGQPGRAVAGSEIHWGSRAMVVRV